MRLIDADAFEIELQHEWENNEISNGEWIDIRQWLKEAPTIDVEPIIRCKDCYYAKPYNQLWQLPKRDTLICTHFANDEVDNNFFCGCAIKMDEVDDEVN